MRFVRPPFWLLLILLLGLVLVTIRTRFAKRDAHGEVSPSNIGLRENGFHSTALPAYAPDRPALQPAVAAVSFPRSPLADALNTPFTTPADDLRTVSRILRLYRERFGAYPAFADNAQLINALTGANPHRIPLLPRDAKAVSATGELLDRWGTPYLFHSISRDAIELRSAGPDRQVYTPDDHTESIK